ncbi:hypothetical protein MKW98_027934 [Papaver atlanticum]|uniref:F-box associated beta-propeller type 3 domain-containing protein n=1 Tax=Papaver atlanticum TaxID=357466 RepID=A0AAD4SBL0_9MAGN|nr:hypothetical protein MKW98_027934 [Papaver atlanticum]
MRYGYPVCVVLTVPSHNLDSLESYVYINGSIYYITTSITTSSVKEKDRPKFLVAFDVGSEKFRTISVPSCVFDQPVDCDAAYTFYNVQLIELDGRLGLFIRPGPRMSGTPKLKLWLFDDDKNKKNSTSSWTQVNMKLPCTKDYNNGISLNPVSGTNQIILSSCVATPDGKRLDTTYYSYNWKNKSYSEIEISGMPYSFPFFFASNQSM